ncbi:MAG TPA: YCF48-related protein [Terriglobia bacterium]|nr:YCF48-related protein [Terriglobia bacterium]
MRELPRIARDRLAAGPVPTPHLDANLISGFVGQSLLPDERQRVIAHLATCEQCRAEVRLVVAVTQPDARGARANAEARPSPQGFSWQRWLRWQPVTAALAVAVIAVFVVVSARRPGSRLSYRSANSPVAMVSKSAPPPSPAPSAGNAALRLQTPPSPGEAKHKVEAAAASNQTAAAARRIQEKQGVHQVAPNADSPELISGNLTAPKVEQAEAREFEIAAPPPPRPASVPAPKPAAAAPQSAAERVGIQAGAAPARGVARAPGVMSVGDFAAKSGASPPSVSALAPAVRWETKVDTAGAPVDQGAVERSVDGGRTWQCVQVADGVTFRAVFALGRNVWAGGTAGAFYHSSDGGEHWSSIPLAATATAVGTSVGDIVSLQFADATHGVVSTSTGVTWTTSDGGQTWQQTQN